MEGSDCADDVIVPIHWAPDCRRKSGLAIVADAVLPPMFFHNASK